jgi:hypothetical protein
MLQLLTRRLNPYSPQQTTGAVPFSRQDILQIITALIENAAPSGDRRIRCSRYSRGLILWAALLKVIPEGDGPAIEQSSLRWPVPLRRRLVSALYYRTKKRWPRSPYGTNLAMSTEQREIAAIYCLHQPLQARAQDVLAGPGCL